MIDTSEQRRPEHPEQSGKFAIITEQKAGGDSIRFQAHLLGTIEQSVIATNLDGNVFW